MRRWLRHPVVQAFLIFLATALLRYSPFLTGQTVFFGDNYSLLIPGKIWTAHWLRQGIFPLWNPLIFSGISWVGDISQTPFSPAVLPFVLFPPTAAINLDILGHLIFTCLGMYFLAKKVSQHQWWSVAVGGLWGASSLWTGSANNLATLQSLSWLPWILWAGLTLKWGAWPITRLALVIAGQVWAGYPQHALIALPAAATLTLTQTRSWRVWLKSWFTAVTIALGLTAGISLPFLPALLESTRQLQSAEQAARGSLHPAELIKIAVPAFFDAPLFGIRWGPNWNFYPTAMPFFTWLGLAVFGTFRWKSLRRDRLAWVLGLGSFLGLILSLGSHLPGYLWLVTNVPGLSTVRYPSSWLLVTELFGLALLAKVAPHWQPPAWLKRWAGPALLLLLAVALAGTALVWVSPQTVWDVLNSLSRGALANSPFHTPERDQRILLLIGGSVSLNALASWLGWQAWRQKLLPVLAGLLILEGIVVSQTLILFAPANVYAGAKRFDALEHTQLLRDPQYRALTRNLNQPYTDYGSYWEAVAVRAPFSDSFVDDRERRTAAHLQRLRDGLTPDWNLVDQVPVVNGYTTLLPADYQRLWEPDGQEARINLLSTIGLDNPLLPAWSVKYYLVDKQFVREESLAYPILLESPDWTVYELPALARFRYADDSASELFDYEETPNRVRFRLETASASALIMADRYETGWTALVNGQIAELRNRSGQREIDLPAGENRVEFRYEPVEVRLGLGITGVTIFGLIFFFSLRSLNRLPWR